MRWPQAPEVKVGVKRRSQHLVKIRNSCSCCSDRTSTPRGHDLGGVTQEATNFAAFFFPIVALWSEKRNLEGSGTTRAVHSGAGGLWSIQGQVSRSNKRVSKQMKLCAPKCGRQNVVVFTCASSQQSSQATTRQDDDSQKNKPAKSKILTKIEVIAVIKGLETKWSRTRIVILFCS